MMNEQIGYLISVIIPVHNAVVYLSDLMRCILNQTLSVEKMQILLLNNSSTDGSEIICREYAEKYTQIQCIELTDYHSVNYVRNLGMSYATGKYIAFLDSNDLWSLNAFEAAVAFLDRHCDEIDAVNTNIEFFGQETGKHHLWFEVSEDYIVDIYTDYQKIAIQCSTFVFKTKIAKEYQFDETHECPDETGYINKLLLRRKKFGWLSGVTYYKRIQNDKGIGNYLFENLQCGGLEKLCRALNDIYRIYDDEYGEPVPMVQYLSAYLLFMWMGEAEGEYESGIKGYKNSQCGILLDRIDDKYLLECPNADEVQKMEMLEMKYHLYNGKQGHTMRDQIKLLHIRTERLKCVKNNFNLLKIWFSSKNEGKSLLQYFRRFHWSQIAIYGMSDLGSFLFEELRGTDIVVQYAIDRRADNMVTNIPVYFPEAELPLVDVIVVTAVSFFAEIVKNLQERVECPIISLEDIIYTMK